MLLNRIFLTYAAALFLFLELTAMSAEQVTTHNTSVSVESKYTPILNTIKHDKNFLLGVANTIIARDADILHMKEMIIKKHGVRSHEIWADNFDVNQTWGPNWSSINGKLQAELLNTFGTKDNVKMTMKRDDFLLASDDVLANFLHYAKTVVNNGDYVIAESLGNKKAPHTIVVKYNFNPIITGVKYKKTSENTLEKESDLKSMYIVFNITDILDQILQSNKHSWEEKKEDWNKDVSGYIATFTPDV